MIERLQQEQQNQNQSQDNRDSNESGPSNDLLRTPRNSRRLQNNRDDSRSAQDSFSPRTPRSQAGINAYNFCAYVLLNIRNKTILKSIKNIFFKKLDFDKLFSDQILLISDQKF